MAHCPVDSPGAAAGLIVAATLHGILGLILPSKRTGLLFLPAGGKVFTELAANECTPETRVTGNVVGEVSPVGGSSTTGKTIFTLTPGAGDPASVKDFDLTHGLGLVKPELIAFTEDTGISQTEEGESSVATEIT